MKSPVHTHMPRFDVPSCEQWYYFDMRIIPDPSPLTLVLYSVIWHPKMIINLKIMEVTNVFHLKSEYEIVRNQSSAPIMNPPYDADFTLCS